MLTNRLRPITWDEVTGQKINVQILRSIVKNPEGAPKSLILEGAYGSGKCVGGETRVHTNLGYIKIKDIPHSNDINNEGFAEVKDIYVEGNERVSHFYYGGKRKVIGIKSDRFDLVGTPNHKIKAFSDSGVEWVRLDQMDVGSYVCLSKDKNVLFNNRVEKISELEHLSDFDYGYMVGFILGDGNVYRERLTITGTIEITDKIMSMIPEKKWCRYENERGIVDIHLNSVEMCSKMLDVGVGGVSYNKKIPEWVYQSNYDVIRGVLSGLIDSDGTVGGIDYCTVSKELSYGVRDLFNILGVYPKIMVSDIKYEYVRECKHDKKVYRVFVTYDEFCNLDFLELKVGYKRDGIKEIADRYSDMIKRNNSTRYVPLNDKYRMIIEEVYQEIKRQFTEKNGVGFKKYVEKYYREFALRYNSRMCDRFTEKSWYRFKSLLQEDIRTEIDEAIEKYRFYRIGEIYEGERLVYDITVPTTKTFYANGMINHNTTLARIIARELNGIKDRDYDLDMSPFYREYDSTIIGNIEKIRELRDTFGVGYEDYWQVIVFDECLSGDTKILLSDGSSMEIKEIVDGELDVEVISYNKELNRVEPKKVCGWFKNNPKIFYNVKTTKQKSFIKASKNHIFVTPEGDKKLCELTIGSKVYRYEYKLSDDERQVIIGTMLGDGYMDRPEKSILWTPRMTLRHGVSQEEWLRLKCEALSGIGSEAGIVKDKKYVDSDKYYENSETMSWNTKSLMCLREFSEMFRGAKDTKKRVTRDILEELTPLGIAVWYLDDGSLQVNKRENKNGSVKYYPCVIMNTQGFSLEENKTIVDYFKETWGIDFILYEYRGYNYLYANTKSSIKFLELVAPYICEGVLDYKLRDFFKCGNGLKNIKKGSMSVIEDEITSIGIDKVIPKPAYDIEVEDNHNYFAGEILVHNCHAVSQQAQNALLKVIEEVRSKTFFVFCTTHIQKIIPTIKSRSLELTFSPVPFVEVLEHLDRVSGELGINVPDDIKKSIALRSRGHMRDVNMLLDKYMLVGEDVFRESVKFTTGLLCEFFIAVINNKGDKVNEVLGEISKVPMRDLKDDFSNFIVMCLKESLGNDSGDEEVKDLVREMGPDVMKLVKHYYSDWMKNIFNSDMDFYAGMLALYMLMKKSGDKDSKGGGATSLRERAVRR